MRGKTCELKAAEPKEAGNGRGKAIRVDRQDPHKFAAYIPPQVYHPPDTLAYPPQSLDAPPLPYPYYAPGVPGFMAPMFYPGPPVQPNMPPPFVGQYTDPHEAIPVQNHPMPPPAHHPHAYAFIPVMAMPPAMPPSHHHHHHHHPYPPTSVMQPVAPGIPAKEDDTATAMDSVPPSS